MTITNEEITITTFQNNSTKNRTILISHEHEHESSAFLSIMDVVKYDDTQLFQQWLTLFDAIVLNEEQPISNANLSFKIINNVMSVSHFPFKRNAKKTNNCP
jgi:hypothetical protein